MKTNRRKMILIIIPVLIVIILVILSALSRQTPELGLKNGKLMICAEEIMEMSPEGKAEGSAGEIELYQNLLARGRLEALLNELLTPASVPGLHRHDSRTKYNTHEGYFYSAPYSGLIYRYLT
jgi:hypothetical protein